LTCANDDAGLQELQACRFPWLIGIHGPAGNETRHYSVDAANNSRRVDRRLGHAREPQQFTSSFGVPVEKETALKI
jgi:hypothetical protein